MRLLFCLHIGAYLACCGGGQSASPQKMAEAEGNRLSGSRVPYGTGEYSALFFIIIFMFYILFNVLGICYRRKIPDLRCKSSDQMPCLIWVEIFCTLSPAHRPNLLLLLCMLSVIYDLCFCHDCSQFRSAPKWKGQLPRCKPPHIQILKRHIFCRRD